jgi:hypothetical protein
MSSNISHEACYPALAMTQFIFPTADHSQTNMNTLDLEMKDSPLLLTMNEHLPGQVQTQPCSFLSGPNCVAAVSGTNYCPGSYTTCQTDASSCFRSQTIDRLAAAPKACQQGGSGTATPHNAAISPMDCDVTREYGYQEQLAIGSGNADADTAKEFGSERFLQARYGWLEKQYAAASEALQATQRELIMQQVCVMEKSAELEDCVYYFQQNNRRSEVSMDRDMMTPVRNAGRTGVINQGQHIFGTAEKVRTLCRKRRRSQASDGQVNRSCKRRRRT